MDSNYYYILITSSILLNNFKGILLTFRIRIVYWNLHVILPNSRRVSFSSKLKPKTVTTMISLDVLFLGYNVFKFCRQSFHQIYMYTFFFITMFLNNIVYNWAFYCKPNLYIYKFPLPLLKLIIFLQLTHIERSSLAYHWEGQNKKNQTDWYT